MSTDNTLQTITTDDKFKEKLLFKNLIMEDETLLTKKEIAKFLSVSVKMIDRKVHMNEIPFLKIGRLVRFSKKRILAWAEGNNSPR
ncbi:MAG: helix-turn-helix domain-containing protein [Bacteriovoracaceae bacterium]|nr:helix-turn-helix domain-containing protein [Bacteriovoracaceae bacterium]